ncbi:hypothetical protein MCEL_20460 [Mycolicibacterium celeriflavum]|uniref:Uncharacterized protein n=1 Tax=Mycolicibacterium celeriflavum TaxID=1249101 RepID=A0A7I7RHW0_MYCCF|nr:hypothetical protein MCEL_20460 [Mycolicibacterium celeriflavum]
MRVPVQHHLLIGGEHIVGVTHDDDLKAISGSMVAVRATGYTEIADMGGGLSSGQGEAAAATVVAAAASLTR